MTPTKAEALFHAVLHMRTLQRLYFQRPITPRLIAAKEAERAVDQLVEIELGVRELPFPTPIPAEEVPY